MSKVYIGFLKLKKKKKKETANYFIDNAFRSVKPKLCIPLSSNLFHLLVFSINQLALLSTHIFKIKKKQNKFLNNNLQNG